MAAAVHARAGPRHAAGPPAAHAARARAGAHRLQRPGVHAARLHARTVLRAAARGAGACAVRASRAGGAHRLSRRPPMRRSRPPSTCPWRGRMLRGEVHDENAAALGGVAGHAGLFGDAARGVRATLGRCSTAGCIRRRSSPISARSTPERSRRTWSVAASAGSLMYPGWSGGDLMSARSIGHTGFTGTGVWIDLERGRYSVLLTNRVHPSRHVESEHRRATARLQPRRGTRRKF